MSLAAPYAPAKPLSGALAVAFTFLLPIPASRPKWWRAAAAAGLIFPRGPHDVDNLAKLALDALTRSGRWWHDDAQVAVLRVIKAYGDGNLVGTEVEIRQYREAQSAADLSNLGGQGQIGLDGKSE